LTRADRLSPSILFALAACGGEGSVTDDRLVSDSAGIEIITLRMTGDNTEMHEPTLLLDLGLAEGAEEYVLAGVAGAVQLSDGRLVVANGATSELRFYSETGEFLQQVGHAGEGPGEFRDIAFLDVLPGDTIIVYDARLRRTSLFGLDGSFIASHLLADASLPYVGGPIGPGGLGAMNFVGEEEEGLGVYTAQTEVGRINVQRGAFEVFDTIPSGEESRVQYQGRITRAFRPFGLESDIAAGGEKLFVLSSGEDGAIRVYAADGTLQRIIRVEFPQRPADAAAVEAWVESWIASFPAGSPQVEAWWRHGFRETPAPASVPSFRSLIADENGNACAERYPLTWTGATTYFCFSSDGHFRRSIRLGEGPVRLGPHAFFDPALEIGADYVLGVWQDSLDVQHVRMYGF
jgi:hypothetical protein